MYMKLFKRAGIPLASALFGIFAVVTLPGKASATVATIVNQKAAALVPQDMRHKGVITVVTDATYAPFDYISKTGKIVGYDIDVSNALAGILGLHAEFTNIKFASIIPGLIGHKYDMSLAAFSITKKREKVVDFVGPYFMTGSALEVRAGNPLHLTMKQLSMCGHVIGAGAASIQALHILPKLSKDCTSANKKPITIKDFSSGTEANLALVSGRIDGVLADSGASAYQAKLSNGRFELAPGPAYKPTPYGIAMPKDSPLEPAIKAALAVMKKDGTLGKIKVKWFGTASAEAAS